MLLLLFSAAETAAAETAATAVALLAPTAAAAASAFFFLSGHIDTGRDRHGRRAGARVRGRSVGHAAGGERGRVPDWPDPRRAA